MVLLSFMGAQDSERGESKFFLSSLRFWIYSDAFFSNKTELKSKKLNFMSMDELQWKGINFLRMIY